MTPVTLPSAESPTGAAEPHGSRERLPESASLLLDVIRFSLALLVVVGHSTLPWFSTAWPPLLGWADVAVPGFFVLSGFMIRYVTQDRERDPRRYFISRASRMYSVLLPAIALTLICRAAITWRNPAYAAMLYRPESALQTVTHALAHLFFFTQFWGHAVLLPPDLPLWSLGYEVPYYVLFGLLALCRGRWRWVVAALYAVLLGPQVLFLAPLWWSGCWLYDVWQWSRQSLSRTMWTAAGALAALLLVMVPFAGTPAWIRMAHLANPLPQLGQPAARATMLAYASGLVSWLVMLLGLCAADRVSLSRRTRWATPVRRAAEGTFTLYLFHYPLLCLVPAYVGHALTTGRATTAMVLGIIAICVLASAPIDMLKAAMRRVLSTHFNAPRQDRAGSIAPAPTA